MARVRKPAAGLFDAITLEGNLISPAMLARIAAHSASGQTEAEYGVPKGLTLRDEIARYFRIGQALFKELFASPTPAVPATISFVQLLMHDVLGFSDVCRCGTRVQGERMFAVTLEGSGGRVPIVVAPPCDDLDRASPSLALDGHRHSAASSIQDWLNANDDALWGMCCNGESLRLVRDNASLTRPAYVEVNLRQLFEGEDFADFTAFWLLVHATRFGVAGAPVSDCALERWREAGSKEGLAARDRLRDGVEAALLALGNGFLVHPDNAALRESIVEGKFPLPKFFGQLLRLVYRLIFLLAAEDRGLLHPPTASPVARKLYAEGYSLGALRDRAVRRAAWDRHHDRWEGLLVTFRSLELGEPRVGLPALGGLFDSGVIRNLENVKLSNRALMDAIYRLAWLKENNSLVPVNWRDMETEELGSVYEGLLELTPRLIDQGRGIAFAEGTEAKGHARKTSGSYYTPDSLVQALLDSVLDPVLNRVESEAEDPAKALLRVTVIDPACGSGHFLLAAARRIATRVAHLRTQGIASAEDYRHALREVVRSCMHGVDRNPMAVELTKVALWIETVEPGKPLGFLDTNVRCGDSLLGVFDLQVLREGIPDPAYKSLAGDDNAAAKYFEKRNQEERDGQGGLDFEGRGQRLPDPPPLADALRQVRALPEDSPEQIEEKRKCFEAAMSDPRRWEWGVAADTYVAAFLSPKVGGIPKEQDCVAVPTTQHVWHALVGKQLYGPLIGATQQLVQRARAFHWPLEFPDVMASGGFDVVLGNPPWERIKLQEQEFFAAREPEIADAPNAAARGRMIARLKEAEPGSPERALHGEFEAAKRIIEASSIFARGSGRFPLTGRGDVNTYSLFAEHFLALLSSNGRAGIIVPTGIAFDDNNRMFFSHLVDSTRLVSLLSFFEVRRWFKATDDRKPFCLLTIGTSASGADFAFDLRTIGELKLKERHFTLSPEAIGCINPNTRTAPVFRSRADAELTSKIYSRVPVLIDERKGQGRNSWGISFLRMFDMATDSGLFRTAAQLCEMGCTRTGSDWNRQTPSEKGRTSETYVPLYEAKMLHHFDHRWGTYDGEAERDVLATEKERPEFEPTPHYWISKLEVEQRINSKHWGREYLLGWRDIVGSAGRTLIPSLCPRVAVGHKFLLALPSEPPQQIAALYGCLASLVCDYAAKQKVGGSSLNYFVFRQLPVLPPETFSAADLAFISQRVLELTYTSHSMAPFARDLGYNAPPFAWDDARRAKLRAELDAWYARAYGLTRDELRYILDPADVKGPDYPSETFRVLKNNEIKEFGEYRTRRLVLEAWDRLALEAAAAK